MVPLRAASGLTLILYPKLACLGSLQLGVLTPGLWEYTFSLQILNYCCSWNNC